MFRHLNSSIEPELLDESAAGVVTSVSKPCVVSSAAGQAAVS